MNIGSCLCEGPRVPLNPPPHTPLVTFALGVDECFLPSRTPGVTLLVIVVSTHVFWRVISPSGPSPSFRLRTRGARWSTVPNDATSRTVHDNTVREMCQRPSSNYPCRRFSEQMSPHSLVSRAYMNSLTLKFLKPGRSTPPRPPVVHDGVDT